MENNAGNGSTEGKVGFVQRVKMSGPAWMAAGLNIGGATVTNSVLLAAAVGMAYGYVFPLATITIVFITYACVKISIVTKMNPVEVIREKIHPVAGWITGISILIVNVVFHSIMVVLGGSALNGLIPAISVKAGGIIMLAIVAMLIFFPSKKAELLLQKSIKWMIYILSLSFLITLFMVDVDWIAFFKGIFVPTIPRSKESVLLFTAVLGSALAINVPAVQAAASRTKGMTAKDLKQGRFETILTNAFLLFVQFAVMIVVAATLFKVGIKPKNAVQAALALEPLAGKYSTILFCIGLLGAIVSTAAAQTSVAAYTVWDIAAKSEGNGPGTRNFKLIQLALLLVGLSVPIFGFNPFSWVAYGAAFNGTFMPIGIILWLYLVNKKDVMGEHKAGIGLNIGLCFSLIVSLTFAIRFWVVTLG